MHLALSRMHLTLHSVNMIALLEAISVISFSPILATKLGSNPPKASLCHRTNQYFQSHIVQNYINISFQFVKQVILRCASLIQAVQTLLPE